MYTGLTELRTSRFSFFALHFFVLVLLSNVSLVVSPDAMSSEFSPITIKTISVCSSNADEQSSQSLDLKNCTRYELDAFTMQGDIVSIKASFDLNHEWETNRQPLGLVMSARASSVVLLNGVVIGQNGIPAGNAKNEKPGIIDKVYYLPANLLKHTSNILTIELSSHFTLLSSEPLIQRLLIDVYRVPQDYVLRHYLPAFIPLGILIIGLFYSAFLTYTQPESNQHSLIAAAAFFAVLQLFAEVSRGLFFYSYPLHDVRLIVILCAGVLCGACLLSYIFDRFLLPYKRRGILLSHATVLIAIFNVQSIESKTLLAILIPAMLATCITAYAALKRIKTALPHCLALLFFIAALVLQPERFLDSYYYYFVAILFVFFFIQQAIAYQDEKQQRLYEQKRAERLQFALDEYNEKQEPSKIKITHAGKTDWLQCEQICFFKGARDYVEITLSDKRSILHHSTLSLLEETLPKAFLRVHRSYIVNTRLIQSLVRNSSGAGYLVLTSGDEVPVSRRILPKVRSVLN